MKSKLLLFTLLYFSLGFAQETIPPEVQETVQPIHSRSAQLATDSLLRDNTTTHNTIFVKEFDPHFRARYQGPDYDYKTIKPRESFWQKLKTKIAKLLSRLFGQLDINKADFWTSIILKILAIAFGGFMLYVLIRFLLTKESNFFFAKKNRMLSLDSQDLEENIHEINFPQTIEKLERQQDYRSAIRYQFLAVLKNLSDKKVISWNPEKTNQDYVSELKNIEQQKKFQKLAYIFDYVWYGEFEVTEERYKQLKEPFLRFKI